MRRTSAHIEPVKTRIKPKSGRWPRKPSAAPATTRLQVPGREPNGTRIELGDYIVADPLICHGNPTYKGTRIMVWQILEALADGESVEELVKAWGGRVSKAAVLETIRLAGGALLDTRGRLNRQWKGQMAA